MQPFVPNLGEITRLMIATSSQGIALSTPPPLIPSVIPAKLSAQPNNLPVFLASENNAESTQIPTERTSEIPVLKVIGVILIIAGVFYLLKTICDHIEKQDEQRS